MLPVGVRKDKVIFLECESYHLTASGELLLAVCHFSLVPGVV